MRKKESEDMQRLIQSGIHLRELTQSLVKKFPVYAEKLAEAEVKIIKLQRLQQKMFTDISSTTFLKSNAKENAIQSVLLLGNGVKLYALSTGKKSLYEASCYVYSDFNRPVPDLTLARMQQIINAAKRIKNYKKFALTKAIIKDAEEKVKNFKKQMYMPVQHIKEKARYAQESRKMISDIKKHLKTHLLPFFEIIKNDMEYTSECYNFYKLMTMRKRGRPGGSCTKKHADETIKATSAQELNIESQPGKESKHPRDLHYA
jgi:hypothetical protein